MALDYHRETSVRTPLCGVLSDSNTRILGVAGSIRTDLGGRRGGRRVALKNREAPTKEASVLHQESDVPASLRNHADTSPHAGRKGLATHERIFSESETLVNSCTG